MSGWITIGTRVSKKGLKQGLDFLRKQLKKAEEGLSKGLSAGFTGVIKLVGTLGKALFQIVGIIGLLSVAIGGIALLGKILSEAFKKVSEENSQVKANLDYIKFAIGKAIEPAVNSVANVLVKIINFLIRIMQYTALIIQAWTGKNIFENATIDAFEKSMKESEKSSKKTAKNAKDIKKSLAGFDEMNILSDNSSSSGGTSGGGASLPNFDLSNLDDIPIPSWLQWIMDNGDIVISILAGIAAGVIALNLGASAFVALGIGILVASIVMLIQDIITFLNDPTWQNFISILGDIAIGIGALMLIMGNWWGLLVMLVGFVVKLIADNWDAIMGVLGAVGSWIYNNIIKPVGNFFAGLWNGIVDTFKKAITIVKSVFSGVITFFKGIIDKVLGLFKAIGTKVGDTIGNAFKTCINAVLKGVDSIINAPIKGINKLIDIINEVPGINLKPLNTIKFPRLAKGTILNNPGRGVPIGGAIAGEAGREAVLPLSDSRLLEELGSTIGRYITINLTNVTELDGTTIARKMKNLTNNDNFLRNR